jgi:two-component system, chemotaxis family, CheB/CheR fusion protein
VNRSGFPIVGIGASAGGLEAFQRFFERMPSDSGMAFVLILHLPADRKSMLTEIIRRWTTMRVVEAVDGTLVEPDCVYVPPPHAIVALIDYHLGVRMSAEDDKRVIRPIDAFFDSLGSALCEQAIGIVLSGTGSDGALGLKAIKDCGGLTIAQGSDGSAPQYGEMPAGAIATGSVDLVAPVEDIPGHLLRFKGRAIEDADVASDPAQADAAQLQICAILRAQLGHDFSGYRANTFLRRVHRRMQVVNVTTFQEYVARLRVDHDEVTLLFRDLLIRVTSFFRDRDTFETLKTKVIPRLFVGKEADGHVRVWVPGCATGEEAYSLAILLREHMDGLKATPVVQVFATDIDDSAIATARLGRYPKTLLEGLSEKRRDRYFKLSQGSYLVSNEIRDICTFSVHNLVRDPPFSRMDLVSCRNLLIYMDQQLQASVIPVFHYSLIPGGLLLLGGSESVAQHGNLFEPLDKAARIFARRDGRSPALQLGLQRSNVAPPRPHPSNLPLAIDGVPEAPEHGKSPVTASDERPYSASAAVGARILSPGTAFVALRSSRFKETLTSLLPRAQKIAQLEHDLASTREQLQSLTEEHQTAQEELRSTNEELHSVNEEMQSANEELETSKEELQSLNEELHTVNVRLTEKVDELDQTNSDLRNLFDSTEIATIFLDRDLIIRGFTPAVATLYNLIPSDQGRPLTDIVTSLHYGGLRDDVAQVLKTLQPLERRVRREDESAYYIMRILPYREPDSTVSGALVTFVDVTSIVHAEEALLQADVRKDVFLATLSHELRNPLAPIRTAARLLESENLAPDQLARAQSIISRQVVHMSSLLDDLLDVSRITRGTFLLKKEYVDIEALMEEAIEAVQPAIDARQHTLRVERPATPIMLEVDSVRLIQVISNLLANAAKYTPSGGLITLGTRAEAQSLVVFVRDNGVGLAPEMLGKVFSMFTRVESEIGRSEGGLGIGLALAKGLVELHGGRIEARSAGRTHGSEFIVSLPGSLIVDPREQAPKRVSDAANPPMARRVLIADDNKDGAESLGMFLQTLGHEVHIAHSGAQALETAKRLKPDIGVLDIGMPDLNGYEVARRIRLEAWGDKVTLIAVTGWGQVDDRRRAQAAGFDHHLTKPIDPEQLEHLFAPG